ncbi:DUF4097 family beta strand repeat-containing protein [Kribbella monticola]|uniref:DUF4097 family beta strand repeat-containing protein n=1 Tax=Kribbella monticola TaxID=2185285 RepID=UPI000DD4B2A5|nr:DUF4097 family beta strand repeat-containing protein [Kribbella monticola]
MAMADTRQVGALLVAAAGVCTLWMVGDKDSSDQHEVTSKISEVRLDSANADITIKVGDSDKTTVKEKRSYWLVKHGDAYKVDGETLRLTNDCGWQCHVDFEVTVPRGTKVTGEHGSGDLSIAGVSGVDASSNSGRVELEDVSGDVRLTLTSGDAVIDGLSGKLDFDASSGDLHAEHLKAGPVNAKTVSGDLTIALDEATDVKAEDTSGDITVKAPAGDYQIAADTRSGEIDNDLTNNTSADHKITATTVSGDVVLHSN